MTIKGWFHNAGDSYETQIRYLEFKSDVYISRGWTGPFLTFGEAKKDAERYAREQMNIFKEQVAWIKSIKKEL